MATALLVGNGVAQLPVRSLTLEFEAEQAGIQVDFDLPTNVTAVAPRPGLVVVDDVQGEANIAVLPRFGESFPPHAVAHLTISVESDVAGFDGDRVLVPSIDVAGARRRELITIVRQGDYYRFTRIDPEEPIGLSGPAEAARVAARRVIGADRIAQPVDVNIVIDTSASMASAVNAGLVTEVVEVLAGLATVLSRDSQITLSIGSSVATATAQDTSRSAESALHATNGWTSSFDASGFSPTAESMTFVVTDGVPSGIDVLEAAGPGRYHLVLVCSPSAAPLFEGTTTVAMTHVGVSPGTTASALTDPNAMPGLVRSLLRDFIASWVR